MDNTENGDNTSNNSERSQQQQSAPPPTSVTRSLNLNAPLIKKDKRQASSRFNVTNNPDLVALPFLNEIQ